MDAASTMRTSRPSSRPRGRHQHTTTATTTTAIATSSPQAPAGLFLAKPGEKSSPDTLPSSQWSCPPSASASAPSPAATISTDADPEPGSRSDWLQTAERTMQRDLMACKQALGLARWTLQDLEQMRDRSQDRSRERTGAAGRQRAGIGRGSGSGSGGGGRVRMREMQLVIMGCCREYSDSRQSLLRDRLRQVRYWAGSRAMGRTVPDRVPPDWQRVDAEWGGWLADQAAMAGAGAGAGAGRDQQQQTDDATAAPAPERAHQHQVARSILGPLPCIIDTYMWLEQKDRTGRERERGPKVQDTEDGDT